VGPGSAAAPSLAGSVRGIRVPLVSVAAPHVSRPLGMTCVYYKVPGYGSGQNISHLFDRSGFWVTFLDWCDTGSVVFRKAT
jgi:hypothetical protein